MPPRSLEPLVAARAAGSDSFRTSTGVSYEPTATNTSDGSINRYYDPATGQFLSVDPAVAVTQAPYPYAGDDPVNASDPTGEYGWCSTILGVGIFGEWLGCNKHPSSKCVPVSGRINRGDLVRPSDSWLKSFGLDPHEIKQDAVGRGHLSDYEIYRDPDTGNLYVGPKTPGPNSEYQPTGIRIKDGNVEYGVSEPPIEPSAPDIPEIPDIFGE